ncbi:MAG: STAS domain-containing protein [Planctomycetota bacterium]|jgi:anti-sigma B factor antagonist|nr:STAS domain-containing protein [Planctomycetota bacterium]
MPVKLEVETPSNGIAVVKINGRLDATTVGDAEKILLPLAEDATLNRIIMDGANLEYVASAGLRIILKAVKVMAPRKAKLFAAAMPESVLAVLKMTGFNSFVELRATVADCLT